MLIYQVLLMSTKYVCLDRAVTGTSGRPTPKARTRIETSLHTLTKQLQRFEFASQSTFQMNELENLAYLPLNLTWHIFKAMETS